ncbi:hypothetical protein AAHE18_18G074200 [Arachis hypogaea]
MRSQRGGLLLTKGRCGGGRKTLSEIEIHFVFHRKRRRPRMAYGACYLKGTRFFDRGGMPAFLGGPSPRSARRPIGIAAFGLCLPLIYRPGKALATTERKGSM